MLPHAPIMLAITGFWPVDCPKEETGCSCPEHTRVMQAKEPVDVSIE